MGVKSHESDHSKTSILDFAGASLLESFWGLVLGKTERIEKSRDHVLKKKTEVDIYDLSANNPTHETNFLSFVNYMALTFPGTPPRM